MNTEEIARIVGAHRPEDDKEHAGRGGDEPEKRPMHYGRAYLSRRRAAEPVAVQKEDPGARRTAERRGGRRADFAVKNQPSGKTVWRSVCAGVWPARRSVQSY